MENLPSSRGPVGSQRAGSLCATLHTTGTSEFLLVSTWYLPRALAGRCSSSYRVGYCRNQKRKRNLGHSACRHWTPAGTCDHPCLLLSDSGCPAGPAPPPCAFPNQPDIIPPHPRLFRVRLGEETHDLLSRNT